MTRRFAIRCADCLTVAFAHGPSLQAIAGAHASCTACNGSIEVMGEVRGAVIGHEVACSACDERCTNAKGHKCDCPCGGANHGSGAVVWRFESTGPAPCIDMPAPAEAIERSRVWRTLRMEIRNKLQRIHDAGRTIVSGSYQRKFSEVRAMRTHAGRVRSATTLRDKITSWMATGMPKVGT